MHSKLIFGGFFAALPGQLAQDFVAEFTCCHVLKLRRQVWADVGYAGTHTLDAFGFNFVTAQQGDLRSGKR